MINQDIIISGAIAAGGMGLLYYLKSLPGLIYGRIKRSLTYTVTMQDSDTLFFILEKWLLEKYNNKYRQVDATYEHNKGKQKNNPVYYSQSVGLYPIRYMGKTLFIRRRKEKVEHAVLKENLYTKDIQITGWRAKKEIEKLLSDLSTEYNRESEDNRIQFNVFAYGNWTYLSKRLVKPFSDIILNKDVKEYILKDLERYNSSKDWYLNVNIPYKRTYLFYGAPGTGKSTLSFGIASELKRPVYILNLSSVGSDDTLIKAFTSVEDDAILLLEDIDSAFVKRDNKEAAKISFSCLLNCLDGALSKHNLITIMTTNHIDRLDDALLRAGRVDMKLEVEPASDKEISEYLSLFYGQDVKICGGFKIPISQIQEICMRYRSDVSRCKKEIYKVGMPLIIEFQKEVA